MNSLNGILTISSEISSKNSVLVSSIQSSAEKSKSESRQNLVLIKNQNIREI